MCEKNELQLLLNGSFESKWIEFGVLFFESLFSGFWDVRMVEYSLKRGLWRIRRCACFGGNSYHVTGRHIEVSSMKRAISHGQAIRSIFGRSLVIHFMGRASSSFRLSI